MSWRLVLPALALLAGCAEAPRATPALASYDTPLRLIGTGQLAPDLRHGGTRVGGISGIDYDPASDAWLLVSDDRGQHGPARWYRARIGIDNEGGNGTDKGIGNGIDNGIRSGIGNGVVGTVAIMEAVVVRQPDGTPHPAWGEPGISADLEALRIDPLDGSIWVASEGDRRARVPSFVRNAAPDGRFLRELPYPAALQIQPDCECGGRSNGGFEGMSFSNDGRQLWLALEVPPIQDGPVPLPGQGALTRISLVERDGALVAQYAYPLDAAPARAFAGGFVDNGISEILALGARRLLVLERAGRQIAGREFGFDVRLYEVDFTGASALAPDAPIARATVRPGVKRLLFDSTRLPQGWSDNYEAMAWGPALSGGRRSLVIASDNNFNGGPTRFLVFDAGQLQERE